VSDVDHPTALDLLELDLDVRLFSLWRQVWEVESWDQDSFAPFLRVAYWNGYRDALTESQRGKLYGDHHQPVPRRGRCDGEM
jgi:hypothetical protein